MFRHNGTKRTRVTRRITTAAAALSLFGLAACGSAGPETGSAGDELEGLEGTIGSKDFAEQYILAHTPTHLFNAHGADTDTNTSMVGSTNVRSAFESGELDGYWEYTGTAWITYFQETEPLETPEEMFEAVKESDGEDGIYWFNPAPLNNTYSLRSEEHTSELQSRGHLVCRLLLEKKKNNRKNTQTTHAVRK